MLTEKLFSNALQYLILYVSIHIWSFYMWIQPPVDLDGQVVKRPGQVSRNYHLQLICWQILTRPCLPFVYVVAIHRLFSIAIWKFDPFGFISTRYDTQVPEAFFYSFLANFATRTASFILVFFLLARSAESQEKKASGQNCWDPHFHAISFWPSSLIGGYF